MTYNLSGAMGKGMEDISIEIEGPNALDYGASLNLKGLGVEHVKGTRLSGRGAYKIMEDTMRMISAIRRNR